MSAPCCQLREVNTAIDTVIEKNSCAKQACAALTHGGCSHRTVVAPSRPCTMTAPSAYQPNLRIHDRESTREIHAARIIVSNPTVVAIRRWPCSNIAKPPHGGSTWP